MESMDVTSFGSEAELLQDSTNSISLLRKGLDGLRENSAVGGFGPGPVPTIGKARTFRHANETQPTSLGRVVGDKAFAAVCHAKLDAGRRERDEHVAGLAERAARKFVVGVWHGDIVIQRRRANAKT